MRGGWLLLSVVLALPARGAEEPIEAGDRYYATWELLRGGHPLMPDLFRLGWPTSTEWQRLTGELSAEPGSRLVQAGLASRAGIPLSSSEYARGRFEKLKRAGSTLQGPLALVRGELQAFRDMAGAPPQLSIPGGFDPTFLPVWKSEAALVRAWNELDLSTYEWVPAQGQEYRLEGLGFALLAEAEFARQQLTFEREVLLGGKPTKYLGRSGEEGFFGLVALHSAIAKAMELRSLMIDAKPLAITTLGPADDILKLNELQFFLAPGWTTQIGANGQATHTILNKGDLQRSHLRAQAAVLLGLAQLVALCDPAITPGAFHQKLAGVQPAPILDKSLHLELVKLAVFTFRSTRTLHVDVRAGRALSIAGGRTITAGDLGLYLAAIEAFMDHVRLPSGPTAQATIAASPVWRELDEELKRGRTLLSTLAGQIASWDDPKDPGITDRYDVQSNERVGKPRSLETQALCVRGLIAAHKVLAPKGTSRSQYSATAERLMRFLERERWHAAARTYLEPKVGNAERHAKLLGAASILGALRELAVHTQDGRALMRYQQCLESLHARGLYRRPGDKVPPSLAVEVDESPK